MMSIMKVRGRAAVIDILCNASRPPENSRTAAADDWIIPQPILIPVGGSILPRVVIMPSTKVAESAEVTKNIIKRTMDSKESTDPRDIWLKRANSAAE